MCASGGDFLSLLCFWQLTHGPQAAGADVDVAHDAVDFQAAFLYVEYETAARAFLRKMRVIAVQWFAFTYVTTT